MLGARLLRGGLYSVDAAPELLTGISAQPPPDDRRDRLRVRHLLAAEASTRATFRIDFAFAARHRGTCAWPVRDVTPDNMTARAGSHRPARARRGTAPAMRRRLCARRAAASVQPDRDLGGNDQGARPGDRARRHRRAEFRRALRRGCGRLAVRTHGARRAPPLHPRPRHRMRGAGRRRGHPRSGAHAWSAARTSPSGWSRRAGRSGAARPSRTPRRRRARRSSASGATAGPTLRPPKSRDQRLSELAGERLR